MCCLEFRTWQELGAGLLKLRIADTAATAAAACLLCRIRGLVGKASGIPEKQCCDGGNLTPPNIACTIRAVIMVAWCKISSVCRSGQGFGCMQLGDTLSDGLI